MQRDQSCQCEICLVHEEAGKKPYHLKAFDDTWEGWVGRGDPFESIVMTPGYDCTCDGCLERRKMGKKPIHLKTRDNTTRQSTEIIQSRTHDPPKHCLVRCQKCQSSAKALLHLKLLDDTLPDPEGLPNCFECQVHSFKYDSNTKNGSWNCKCQVCQWPYLPLLNSFGYGSLDDIYDGICWGFGRVSYHCSTPHSLKYLIEQRGLKDPFPSGLTYKCFYIAVLEAADHALRFRFQDLPGELRNLVYYELLISDCWGSSRYPQILGTNRKIHNEAAGILYGEQPMRCEIKYKYSDSGWAPAGDLCYATISLAEEPFEGWTAFGVDMEVFKACEASPNSKLRRVHDLTLTLYLGGLEGATSLQDISRICAAISKLLLVFVSSMMGQHGLRKLSADFIHCLQDGGPSPPLDPNLLETVLYPLRRLRDIKKVEIYGAPDALAKSMAEEMQSDQPAFNTLHEFRRVEALLASYLDFVHTHHLEDFAGKDTALDELLILAASPFLSLELRGVLLLSKEDEPEVCATIADLQNFLDRLGPLDLLVSRFS